MEDEGQKDSWGWGVAVWVVRGGRVLGGEGESWMIIEFGRNVRLE